MMRQTISVFGHGDVECRVLNRKARNILPGDIVRWDAGDGITVRWVHLQVVSKSDAGRSWFRNVRQTNFRFSYPGYPKEGSTWGQPYWAPLGGWTTDSDDTVEIFRPIDSTARRGDTMLIGGQPC